MSSAGMDAFAGYGSPLEPKVTRHFASYVPPFVLGEAFVILTREAEEPSLLIDSEWFLDQAREMSQLSDVRAFSRPRLGSEVAELASFLAGVLRDHGLDRPRVGVLPQITPAIYGDALAAVSGGAILDATTLVDEVLALKTSEDARAIRRAAAIGDEAMEAALGACGQGVPEYEVGLAAQRALARAGADIGGGATLRSHVMLGLGSKIRSNVRPYDYTSREMQRGDMFFIDITASYHGYCTDLCRTVVIGSPSREQEHMYACVLAMHDEIIRALAPGVTGDGMWQRAADVAREYGFGSEDLNAVWLGHGIGFSVAEPPYFVPGERRVVRPSSFFAVEPGLLRSNGHQAVVEDVVFVRGDGAERLTTSSLDLFVGRT